VDQVKNITNAIGEALDEQAWDWAGRTENTRRIIDAVEKAYRSYLEVPRSYVPVVDGKFNTVWLMYDPKSSAKIAKVIESKSGGDVIADGDTIRCHNGPKIVISGVFNGGFKYISELPRSFESIAWNESGADINCEDVIKHAKEQRDSVVINKFSGEARKYIREHEWVDRGEVEFYMNIWWDLMRGDKPRKLKDMNGRIFSDIVQHLSGVADRYRAEMARVRASKETP
jgi:hypothetical protein